MLCVSIRSLSRLIMAAEMHWWTLDTKMALYLEGENTSMNAGLVAFTWRNERTGGQASEQTNANERTSELMVGWTDERNKWYMTNRSERENVENFMFLLLYFRHDYLKALHMDPLCLSARVNLGYNLQVSNEKLCFKCKLIIRPYLCFHYRSGSSSH